LNIGDKIREEMTRNGIKQKDLVEYLNVTQGTVAKWLSKKEENRREIPTTLLFKLSSYIGVEPAYLLGLQEYKRVSMKYVPLLGLASCGVPVECDLNGYEPVPVSSKMYKEGMYAVQADGESMSPKINHGNIVYCQKETDIENGDIVHYSFNGESGIKKYKHSNDKNIITLFPLNDKFDTIFLTIEESSTLYMSKVVGVMDTNF